MSRQKVLDTGPKAIQQLEFVGQLKNPADAIVASNFVSFNDLKKINEARLTFSQRSLTVLWKMANYEEAIVKLTNTKLKKIKSAAKNKT